MANLHHIEPLKSLFPSSNMTFDEITKYRTLWKRGRPRLWSCNKIYYFLSRRQSVDCRKINDSGAMEESLLVEQACTPKGHHTVTLTG